MAQAIRCARSDKTSRNEVVKGSHLRHIGNASGANSEGKDLEQRASV